MSDKEEELRCWICHRSKKELKKYFGKYTELKEISGAWKISICTGCQDLISSVILNSDLIDIDDLKKIFNEIPKLLDAIK
ncbi:MAG: hypothetical protein NWE92_01730 [Candidatus Bathyarchaeota archaeon]|nr:hypothetical protein [Candidatus Bathyarchaeota archaeon]